MRQLKSISLPFITFPSDNLFPEREKLFALINCKLNTLTYWLNACS